MKRLEQISGCRIPGCQCKGRIENMEWGSEDMTDTDDSEWEDPDEREKRLYVERYNFDHERTGRSGMRTMHNIRQKC